MSTLVVSWGIAGSKPQQSTEGMVNLSIQADLDALDPALLRTHGSLKWTTYAPEVRPAFVGEMDFGTSPQIVESIQEGVAAGLFGYTPPWMIREMQQSCAEFMLDHYDWNVNPDHVQPMPDVLRALELTIEHLTAAGSPIIVPTPAYMPFLAVPPRLGRAVIEVPMLIAEDGYVMDLDAIDSAFSAGGSLLVLCNPHNPTGRVFGHAELTMLSEIVQRHHGRVFSDEIHAPLVYEGRHSPYASVSPDAAAHTVTATSASKAWNIPGLKCAQLIATNPADRDTLNAVGDATTGGAASLGMIANTAAYRHGGPWLDDIVAYLRRNRDALTAQLKRELPAVGFFPPAATYMAWLDLRALGPHQVSGSYLHDRGQVAVVDGAACGASGFGFIRVNFATSLPLLEETISRLTRVLAGIRQFDDS